MIAPAYTVMVHRGPPLPQLRKERGRLGHPSVLLDRENRPDFFAMNQKIPPEILDWKEYALVRHSKAHLTMAGVDHAFRSTMDTLTSFIDEPRGHHVINGEFRSLIKDARFS